MLIHRLINIFDGKRTQTIEEELKKMQEFLNRVIHGDCSEIMQYMPSESVDLTVTSPPYDGLRDYKGFSFPFEEIANQLYRVTKDGGIVVWIVGDQTKDFCESMKSFKQAFYFKEIGFKLLDTMIYAKKSYAPAYPTMRRYAQTFEYMFVFVKGKKPKTFNPIQTEKSESSIVGEKTSSYRQADGTTKKTRVKAEKLTKAECNVWVYDVGFMKSSKDKISFEHPATFPEQLALDHILSWSNERDVILDCFSGSGTTFKMG